MEDAVNVHYLAGCDRIENWLGMNVTFPPIHERQKVENLGAGILVSSVWPGVGSFCVRATPVRKTCLAYNNPEEPFRDSCRRGHFVPLRF